jgi:simple sugar transport system permease protein
VALISFVLLFIFFVVNAPHFLTPLSIGNILTFGSITGIVTIGVAMLMVSGEFDLSVGRTCPGRVW